MIPRKIIIHHTASSRDRTTIRDIDNWHRVRWQDFKSSLGYWVGYHYVILANGDIVQTRKDNELGAHSIPNNGKIGIALTGNFDIEKPSENQLASLRQILEKLKDNYRIKEILGHCEVNKTSCPGKNLMSWIHSYRLGEQSAINKLSVILQKIRDILEKIREYYH